MDCHNGTGEGIFGQREDCKRRFDLSPDPFPDGKGCLLARDDITHLFTFRKDANIVPVN